MLTKYVDAMSKRDPFDGLLRVGSRRDIIHDIFDDLFNDIQWHNGISLFKNTQWPDGIKTSTRSYRFETNDTEMIASFDLPGVKPDDVEISVIDQRLIITYTFRDKKHSQEYDIDNNYDASAAVARLEHGVLEIRFPRVTRTKGKKIAIEVK